jgi:hypothetical protein
VPFVLVNSPAFGIQLPNGHLYREPEARQADPYGQQPTVWFLEESARAERAAIAAMLETWYGINPEGATELRVVRLEMDTDGIWKLPLATEPACLSYRPIDPDTELVSQWPCASRAELSIDDARQVLREHKECAGLFPCRIRGRARGLLAREHAMTPDSKHPDPWKGLDFPDTAWSGGRIGGTKLVHLAGKR